MSRITDDPVWQMASAVWRNNPSLYAETVLKVKWWQKQTEIANNLVKYKRVFVKASHAVGKSFLAAGIVNWFFDSFPESIVITTAPTQRQVIDVLWKEVRTQRRGRPGLMPKEPRMDMPGFDNWFAVGMTATDDQAFHGRHAKRILIIFDEAVGIDPDIWRGAKGMMTNANAEVYWLCICNPTDPATQAYSECQKGSEYEPAPGQFKVMSISALDHPNISAQLAGEEPPYPDAVGIQFIDSSVEDWCTAIDAQDAGPGDFLWRGNWYTPGPEFEGKVLGRWPSSTSDGVWSDVAWRRATAGGFDDTWANEELVLAADLAQGGRDFTSIVARRGRCVFHHETHNGWSAGQIASRLKELARELSYDWESPKDVRIQIDHDAVGYSIKEDHAEDYNFISISGASRSDIPERYTNIRSQLWFSTAEKAVKGEVDFSLLPAGALSLLEQQLKAPKWRLDASGRRVVEKKVETKKRLGRSPDDADAINLLFYNSSETTLRMGRNSGIIATRRNRVSQSIGRRNMKRKSVGNVPSFLR